MDHADAFCFSLEVGTGALLKNRELIKCVCKHPAQFLSQSNQ